MRLAGKVAVVTGATSGFGLAITRLFAAEGAALILNSRSADAGERLVTELRSAGTDAHFVCGDVGNESTADEIAECARERHGRIDGMILNAGIGYPGVGPFWEVPVEDFDLVFQTNVRGVWLCARACVPLLPEGASIVVMASISSMIVVPGETVYSSSKGAVLQMTRGMAGDLAERGIRVNAVCPGICDTPLTRYFIDAEDDPEATESEFNRAAPIGRMGSAEEIAKAVLFLTCADSSYCTGSSLVADGGYLIR
jgi:meso-butanediol dehydrogenase / (S,S)-butanediol dehydrogenase / diacetyl reductase